LKIVLVLVLEETVDVASKKTLERRSLRAGRNSQMLSRHWGGFEHEHEIGSVQETGENHTLKPFPGSFD